MATAGFTFKRRTPPPIAVAPPHVWPFHAVTRCAVLPTAISARAQRPQTRTGKRVETVECAPSNAAQWAEQALGFIPDPKQRQVLESSAPRGILNCTRQWGKSTTCAIKAVHHAHRNPGSLVLVASPSLRQSSEFLEKARKFLVQLGIRARGDGQNRCSLMLPNGSRIIGLPESEGTVRGFSQVGLLILDEASRVSDNLYGALRPMLAVGGGSLWLMSTPNGRSGFFFREWSDTSKPWVRIQATAEECPRIPSEFLREEKLTLSDEMYRQEYMGEFVCSDGALFDEDRLRSCFTAELPPLW
jgi:hypothetical protein